MALVASVATVSVAPLSASATATNKCLWYDFDIQPKTPGAPAGPFDNCVEHPELEPEASYYWTDETSVFYEPQAQAFDYSAFSQLNPFTGDGYSFRKANELFPTTPDLSAASAKLNYAQTALGAKPRAIENRRSVSATDACSVIPHLMSDSDIRRGDGWLAPVARPGGPNGYYTYELSAGLTTEQRAAVLDALRQFDGAKGPRMPDLVPRAPDDPLSPIITFTDGSGNPEMGDDAGGSTLNVSDKGRDGLTRWVSGTIELTRDVDLLNSRTVAHEIAHVFQFDDTFGAGPTATMAGAPGGQGMGSHSSWTTDGGASPPAVEAFDICLRKAFADH